MKFFSKYALFLKVIILFMVTGSLFSQNEDSLLQKVNNIDIALDSPPDSIENLYMNTVSFQSFYDVLSPVGEWIQISKEEVDEDLGEGNGQSYSSLTDDDNLIFIWKPVGTENGWHPYTNGKWVYTNRGWYWHSNENWGSDVYHYGRWWNSSKHGWVWMPGYVWAPAWVIWKVEDNHIGWTALTPRAKWKIETGITESNYKFKYKDADWVFVPKSNFADDISKDKIVPSSLNGGLVSGSKTILNIKSDNDAVVHSGPDAKEIERVTGKPVTERKIKFVKDRSNTLIGEKEVSVFKEPLKKYKNREEKKNFEKYEHPRKFKRTDKAKKIIKRRHIERRIKIRKQH